MHFSHHWSLLWVLYPKHVSQFQGLKNIPFFPNFAVFDTLFNVRAYIDCWKKKQPFLLVILYEHHIHLWIQVPPPPRSTKQFTTHQKHDKVVENIELSFSQAEAIKTRLSIIPIRNEVCKLHLSRWNLHQLNCKAGCLKWACLFTSNSV